MADWLSGALCVFAAASARSSLSAARPLTSTQRRGLWEIGAAGMGIVLALGLDGGVPGLPSLAAACALVAVGALMPRPADDELRPHAGAWLATALLVASMFPEMQRSSGPFAIVAGGVAASLLRWSAGLRVANGLLKRIRAGALPAHLIGAGVCAVLAYLGGRQPGAPAVLSFCAATALVVAHLALALGGRAGAPAANAASGGAAFAMVIGAAWGASNVLAVAGVAVALGCAVAYCQKHASLRASPYAARRDAGR
jgi:hypothetical protein